MDWLSLNLDCPDSSHVQLKEFRWKTLKKRTIYSYFQVYATNIHLDPCSMKNPMIRIRKRKRLFVSNLSNPMIINIWPNKKSKIMTKFRLIIWKNCSFINKTISNWCISNGLTCYWRCTFSTWSSFDTNQSSIEILFRINLTWLRITICYNINTWTNKKKRKEKKSIENGIFNAQPYA